MRTACLLAAAVLALPVLAAPAPDAPGAVAVYFESDPLAQAGVVLDGAVLDRLTWSADGPAFPGDRPGSLAALYDATLPPGRIGWPLPQEWTGEDPFIAAAVFVIDPDELHADPFGFFQVSWGLWNSGTTGLERTGTFTNFAGDTFELLEFDYFPNVSPFFGGPFLSPTVFGVADTDNPLFGLFGSFANVAFGGVEVELPSGEPLLSVLEHRPADDAMVVSVHRISADGSVLPVPGAVTVVPLSSLALREYGVDTIGLTLWRDGFTGPTPSMRALVIFHAIVARPGAIVTPGESLGVLAPSQ